MLGGSVPQKQSGTIRSPGGRSRVVPSGASSSTPEKTGSTTPKLSSSLMVFEGPVGVTNNPSLMWSRFCLYLSKIMFPFKAIYRAMSMMHGYILYNIMGRGYLKAPVDKSISCSYSLYERKTVSFYARWFDGIPLECHRKLIPFFSVHSQNAGIMLEETLPTTGPVLAVDLHILLSLVVGYFDLKYIQVPNVYEVSVLGHKFLHFDTDTLIPVLDLLVKLLTFDGYVGAGGVDPAAMIKTAASVGAATIAANKASTMFRESLDNMTEVKTVLDDEDQEWILKDRSLVMFSNTDTVSHDHPYMAACREIIRKDFDNFINLKTTDLSTLIIGAGFREYRMYNTNAMVSFQFAALEGKDSERVVMGCLDSLRKSKMKKRKKVTHDALEKVDKSIVSIDSMMLEFKKTRRIPDRILLWSDTKELVEGKIEAKFDVLVFQDVGYNFSEKDWGTIFRCTGAVLAYGYMCLPWQLVFPDTVVPYGYTYKTEGSLSFMGYGYSNGYVHGTKNWGTLLSTPLIECGDFNIGVEILSRIGPMTLLKLYRCYKKERITRYLALPDYLVSIAILDVDASYDRLRREVNMDNLIYYPVRSSEFNETVNYGLDVAKESLTYNNIMLFVRRRSSGVSLVTKHIAKTWSIEKERIPSFSLNVFLYTRFLVSEFSEIQDFVKERKYSIAQEYLMRVMVKPLKSLRDFIDLFKSRDMFELLTKDVDHAIWQDKLVRISMFKSPNNKVDTEPDSKSYLVDKHDFKEDDEEIPDSFCGFCELLKTVTGEQVFTCDRTKSEHNYHEFSLTLSEINKMRGELLNTENDPIGLRQVKEKAATHVPAAVLNHRARVYYISGPPGTGKSRIIRSLATSSDLVVVPFSRLKTDYENFLHPITGKRTSLKVKTQHMAFMELNKRKIFVDEYTAFPYEFLSVIVSNCGAQEVIFVGDQRQIHLINEVEGVSLASKINFSEIRQHELVKNFRNPSDAVNVLNFNYGYSMLATNNRVGYRFDSTDNYEKYVEHTPLFFTHMSARTFGIDAASSEKVTVRANQGATYEKVKLVILDTDHHIFNMPPMAIVALSRHKEECVILTEPKPSSTAFTAMIKNSVNKISSSPRTKISPSFTREELNNYMGPYIAEFAGPEGVQQQQDSGPMWTEEDQSWETGRVEINEDEEEEDEKDDDMPPLEEATKFTARKKDDEDDDDDQRYLTLRIPLSPRLVFRSVCGSLANFFSKLANENGNNTNNNRSKKMQDVKEAQTSYTSSIAKDDESVSTQSSTVSTTMTNEDEEKVRSEELLSAMRDLDSILVKEMREMEYTSNIDLEVDQEEESRKVTKYPPSVITYESGLEDILKSSIKLRKDQPIIEVTTFDGVAITIDLKKESVIFITSPDKVISALYIQAVEKFMLSRYMDELQNTYNRIKVMELGREQVNGDNVSDNIVGEVITPENVTPTNRGVPFSLTSPVISSFTPPDEDLKDQKEEAMLGAGIEQTVNVNPQTTIVENRDVGTKNKVSIKLTQDDISALIAEAPTENYCLLDCIAKLTDNTLNDVWAGMVLALGADRALQKRNRPLSTEELNIFCNFHNVQFSIQSVGMRVVCGVSGGSCGTIMHLPGKMEEDGHFYLKKDKAVKSVRLKTGEYSNVKTSSRKSARSQNFWDMKFKWIEMTLAVTKDDDKDRRIQKIMELIGSDDVFNRRMRIYFNNNIDVVKLRVEQIVGFIKDTPMGNDIMNGLLMLVFLNKQRHFWTRLKKELQKVQPHTVKLTGAKSEIVSMLSYSAPRVAEAPPDPFATMEKGFEEMARLFVQPFYLRNWLVQEEIDNEYQRVPLEQTPYDCFKLLVEEFATMHENSLVLTNQESSGYLEANFGNGVFDLTTLDNLNQRGHPKRTNEKGWCLLNVAPGVTFYKNNLHQAQHCLQTRYLTQKYATFFSTKSVDKAREIADMFYDEHLEENFDVFNEQDIDKTVYESEHAMLIKNYHQQTTFDMHTDTSIRFAMKDIFKPFKNKIDVFKAGQGISAWSKDMQTIFQTAFRLINKHFINSLRPHVVYDNGIDEFDLILRVNVLFMNLPLAAVNGVIDATACDSGQNLFTQQIERRILERLGIHEDFLDWYYQQRESYVLKGYGVTAKVKEIKTSGEPATLLNNTILMACLMNYLLRGEGPCVLVIKGDDGLKRQANMNFRKDLLEELGEFLKMQMKVDIDIPITFCGYFLSGSTLLPDVVRKCFKIIGHRFRDYDHFCEYQQSLRDWVLVVNKWGVNTICQVTADSYGFKEEYCHGLFSSIVSLTHINRKQFESMFIYKVIEFKEEFLTSEPWSEKLPWYKGDN